MKTIKITTLVLAGLTLAFTSCKKEGCTDETAFNYNEEAKKDDQSCTYDQNITLKFTQEFNDVAVTADDLDEIKFTNEHGEKLSIIRLRYSISDVRFYKADGDSVLIDMHHLIDLSDANSLSTVLATKINPGEYTGVGFNYGFTAEDNVSGAYTDLNQAVWNWPDMIGGGYHQMQMDGRYINSNDDTLSYNFHNGSATKNQSTGEVTTNYVFVKLANSSFTADAAKTIDIKMQIDEWYKNPNLWDLNVLYTSLMPNYDAQLLISENAKSVFTLGGIN
ncbi:hypothetical protein DNU06_05540 [Putridiphycobacter roseus]|uniref:Copper-binding protein MbnP-like domain-containing protein n=1 Tax=Putridiphycobacter roseus TaxID=2219161 RepID=A0A2W1NTM2_9FLAO|nr:MbnP family protein [Putridiphycobacter roseus]PZE18078.1 hypothetical protein DNU06_05540 [Putridiphycobacter roseus]